MAKLVLLTALLAIIGVSLYLRITKTPELPKMDLNKWWGPKEMKFRQDTSVRPFKIQFTSAMIKDLTHRLNKHRPITPAVEEPTQFGLEPSQLEEIIRYWTFDYPFADRERFLNQFPQYKINVQGLDIHFIRVKPKAPSGTEVLPLLMMHGWPGSVREFYDAIPLLTAVSQDRDFAVELIVPSLPGFGFSSAAVIPGLGAAEIAVVMRNFMHHLGYQRFYVQGGDWGSFIGTNMATLFPDEVLGFHTNMPIVNAMVPNILSLLGSLYPRLLVDSDKVDRMYPLSKFYSSLLYESGYLHLQATKPDTVGVSLTDSPAGLAAYILDKFATFTIPHSSVLPACFTKEALIDNLMYYWATNSATTAARIYAETFNSREFGLALDDIPTPVTTWALQAKNEISYQPSTLLKYKYSNLVNATVLENGGHFIAMELPEVFAGDVIKALGEFRKIQKIKKDEL